ncbi:MAG: FMN-binding protein [Bacillota bacterium]|jgi:RnfABCDGE-type electron transport complex G subunit
MKDMAKLGITLMIVCAVAGLGLAAVYAKTAPVIEQRAQEDLLAALKAAIPGADEIVEETEGDQSYWLGKKAGQVIGGAMKVTATSFGGPMELMVGIDAEGKISRVEILSIADTPGIGLKVKDIAFLAKFAGQENPNKVDSIAGATVSSSAVKGGVAKAVEVLGSVLGPGDELGPIDLASVPDGTYTGTGLGLRELQVAVTVAGGKITEIKIVSHDESPGYSDPAIAGIPKAIIEKQDPNVDAVSGATFTSQGIVEAVKDALKEFAGKTGKAALDISKIADGTYEGTGLGLRELKVAVTVAGGKITEVKIVSHDESPGIADPALIGVPKAIVEKQSVEVDAVTGATFTSQGIMEAVEEALAGAPTK